jgi:hypothetical protein
LKLRGFLPGVAWCVPSSEAMGKGELRKETRMREKFLVLMALLCWCTGGVPLAAQEVAAVKQPELGGPSSAASASTKWGDAEAQAAPTAGKLAEVIERIVKREREEMAAFDLYSPIIETYIQEVKPDKQLGLVPKSDVYLLGQADFRGGLKVHSMTVSEKKGSLQWSFVPAGFLQMILWIAGGSTGPTTASSISGGIFWAR